jgi:hypothetical protein
VESKWKKLMEWAAHVEEKTLMVWKKLMEWAAHVEEKTLMVLNVFHLLSTLCWTRYNSIHAIKNVGMLN